jgi:sulfite dehydrogenase (quinone) subunit SoeC
MHPAYSVILFTTLSGAGYGLYVWVASYVLVTIDLGIPLNTAFVLSGLMLALALMICGLLASTAHLGRPERAWRAFSQWRTSWLSREGLLAIATFAAMVPMILRAGIIPALQSFVTDEIDSSAIFAVLTLISLPVSIILAIATVICTGMIYQSLPTIRAWHQPLVTPLYVAMALASGAVLLVLLLRFHDLPALTASLIALLFLILACVWKMLYWRIKDSAPRTHTVASATGLGAFGNVRPLDPPHTQANYIMREMGYQVARKHVAKLRMLALALGFVVPAVFVSLAVFAAPAFALFISALAAVSMTIGLFTERWLFFAEAEHVVMLFYGRQAA